MNVLQNCVNVFQGLFPIIENSPVMENNKPWLSVAFAAWRIYVCHTEIVR